MDLYLCGNAALDVMRYLRSVNDGLIPGSPSRPKHLARAVRTNKQLGEMSDDALRILSHVQGTTQALVPKPEYVTRTSKLTTHLWSHEITRGMFFNLKNGIQLSSPPFLFLQLATELDQVDLIRVGLELCGWYSLWKLPEAFPHRKSENEFDGATFKLQSVLTAGRLNTFVRRMGGEHGARQASRALKYVANNSASPMESAVYLLLHLPRRMGGFGLPEPILNAKVAVTTSTTSKYRYPDLYWPKKCVDVEYQSDKDHSGEWSRYRDARREIELEAESVTVLPLTRHQIMDRDEFIAFATSVRRRLGIRSRPLQGEWNHRHAELRKKLLGKS